MCTYLSEPIKHCFTTSEELKGACYLSFTEFDASDESTQDETNSNANTLNTDEVMWITLRHVEVLQLEKIIVRIKCYTRSKVPPIRFLKETHYFAS